MGIQSQALVDIRPCQIVEDDLVRIEYLPGAYSMDCIGVTCYNIQVTSALH